VKVTHILRPGKASEKTPKGVIPPSLCEISQNASKKRKKKGKAGKNLLIPCWQQQQQHRSINQSNNPSNHPRSVDSIWAAAVSETARSNNGMETDGSMNGRRMAILTMMEIGREVEQRHGDGDGDIHFTSVSPYNSNSNETGGSGQEWKVAVWPMMERRRHPLHIESVLAGDRTPNRTSNCMCRRPATYTAEPLFVRRLIIWQNLADRII
jgi:hypothetical protein